MSEKTRSRLGRGLSSLLSMEIPTAVEPSGDATNPLSDVALPPPASVLALSLDAVSVNPHQPRRVFDDAALASLAASMSTAGVIQPILVRPAGDGRYELIAGERRLRAARLANLPSIPAIVREADRVTQAQLALIENTHRQDLNPIERAQAYRTLLRDLNLTQADLAERLGEDRSSIANYLRLLDLPPEAQLSVQAGLLSLGHAKVLASLEDPGLATELGNAAVSQGWSVRVLEQAVAKAKGLTPAPAPAADDDSGIATHLREVEKSIARALGMRVKLSSGRKGSGRIVIQYASLTQFDQLMDKLGVDVDAR